MDLINEKISCEAFDGTILKGRLLWNEKDYIVDITEPFKAEAGGGHLMYAVPAVYVLKEEDKVDNIECIPILDIAKEALKIKYKKEIK